MRAVISMLLAPAACVSVPSFELPEREAAKSLLVAIERDVGFELYADDLATPGFAVLAAHEDNAIYALFYERTLEELQLSEGRVFEPSAASELRALPPWTEALRLERDQAWVDAGGNAAVELGLIRLPVFDGLISCDVRRLAIRDNDHTAARVDGSARLRFIEGRITNNELGVRVSSRNTDLRDLLERVTYSGNDLRRD